MKAVTPFAGIQTLRKEMDRLFDRFGGFELPDLGFDSGWTPSLDVSETDDAIVVKAEIPGIEPKDVQVSITENVLTISGEKVDEKEAKDRHYYRKERTLGTFARSIGLPVPVESAKGQATFRNGLLTITLPKVPAAKAATIPVKAA